MADTEFSDRVKWADQWSRVAALLVAMAVFLGTMWLTDDVQFSSIVAAFTGIGTRFFIPYRVSLSVPADERKSIEDHPATGSFHHGAVGGALVLGSLATVALMLFVLSSTPSLVMGTVLTGLAYVALEELLPRG
jgi:hypothetical protein